MKITKELLIIGMLTVLTVVLFGLPTVAQTSDESLGDTLMQYAWMALSPCLSPFEVTIKGWKDDPILTKDLKQVVEKLLKNDKEWQDFSKVGENNESSFAIGDAVMTANTLKGLNWNVAKFIAKMDPALLKAIKAVGMPVGVGCMGEAGYGLFKATAIGMQRDKASKLKDKAYCEFLKRKNSMPAGAKSKLKKVFSEAYKKDKERFEERRKDRLKTVKDALEKYEPFPVVYANLYGPKGWLELEKNYLANAKYKMPCE